MVRNDVSFAHCTYKRINYVANKFISAHSLALLGIFFLLDRRMMMIMAYRFSICIISYKFENK